MKKKRIRVEKVDLLAKVKQAHPDKVLTPEERLQLLETQNNINKILRQCANLEDTKNKFGKSKTPDEALQNLDTMSAAVNDLRKMLLKL